MSLGSILNNPQAVSSREFGDLSEIHRSTVEMHRDDRPRARGNHRFCRAKVEVEGGRIHVSKDRPGSHVADRFRRSKESICGNENFVSRTDIGDLQCQFQGRCS